MTALSKYKSHSPSPDDIPYIFLLNLPASAYHTLMDIYNMIFNPSGYLPFVWKRAITIPIPKPGKNKFETNGYRPISLLNIMCKVLEKIKKKTRIESGIIRHCKTIETTWCPHILHKLKNILSNGKMLNFINSSLTDRTFSVKVNEHISPQY